MTDFPQGSCWLRVDFHLHTKADKEFQYTGGDDDCFISDYVNALKLADIRLGVVFSDKWIENGQNHINSFLTSVFERKTPAQYENENGSTSLALRSTIEKLEAYNKDFSLVFAHVEDKSGLWNKLASGRLQELSKSKLFADRH